MMTLHDSLKIENNPEIFNFRFASNNMLMWPFIRMFLHRIAIYREHNFINNAPVKEKQGFISSIHYLKNTITKNPFRKNRQDNFDILMFNSGTANVKKENAYFNRVSDYFASIYKDKTVLIEDSFQRKYALPRSFPSVYYHDYILLKALLCSRLKTPSKKDQESATQLVNYLKKEYPYELDSRASETIINTVLSVSKKLEIYHSLYNRLFDVYDPKVLFLEDACYGQRSYILYWAKKRGIVTIEPQHGILYEDHPAYNYGNNIIKSGIYSDYLPDYLFTYSTHWNNLVNVPVKKISIGNPNYSEHMRKLKQGRSNHPFSGGRKIRLLFISGGTLPELTKQILLDLYSLTDKNNYEIVFRPHPCEMHTITERYSDLLKTSILLDTEKDVYTSLFSCDYLAGEFSTVLFEGLGICRGVFVIDHPFTDLVVSKQLMKRFSNAKELFKLIQAGNTMEKITTDLLWDPKWKLNYRNFMDQLLKDKIHKKDKQ